MVRRRSAFWAWIGSCIVLLAASPAQGVDLPGAGAQCKTVSFRADVGHCSGDGCDLVGSAFLVCGDLRLWGDSISVRVADGEFAGAQATGNVVMVEGNTLVRCDQLELAGDRVRGRIHRAELLVKKTPLQRDADGVLVGPNEGIFHGDLERLSDDLLIIRDGDFTICDCDDVASWRVSAPEVQITPGERATIWWPTFEIAPFGTLIPITPPLLPLSVALEDRAPGFLTPSIRLLGFPHPTIDLPFFVPLGRSLDLTLSPGIRTDWAGDSNPAGAPRLGGRARYTPTQRSSGEANWAYTYDAGSQGAEAYYRNKLDGLGDNPSDYDIGRAAEQRDYRRGLVHRVRLFGEHRSAGDNANLVINYNWLSDDYAASDFGDKLDDRVANAATSRLMLQWWSPWLSLELGVDYLQKIGGAGRSIEPNYRASNVDGAQDAILQRTPSLRLGTQHVHLGAGVTGRATAGILRLGTLGSDNQPTVIGDVGTEIAYGRRFGPLNTAAHISGFRLQRWSTDSSDHRAAVIAGGEVSTQLARRYGTWVHSVAPYVGAQGVPAVGGDATDDPLDRRFALSKFTQWRLGARQSLLLNRKVRPFTADLFVVGDQTGDLLAVGAHLKTEWRFLEAGAYGTVQPVLNRSGGGDVHEMGANLKVKLRGWQVSLRQARRDPRAEAVLRTPYQLVGVHDGEIVPTHWVHTLRGGLRYVGDRWRFSYSTLRLMPLPDHIRDHPYFLGLSDDTRTAIFDSYDRRPFAKQHTASIGYISGCDCWAFEVRASKLEDEEPRINFEFSVGEYAIGTK